MLCIAVDLPNNYVYPTDTPPDLLALTTVHVIQPYDKVKQILEKLKVKGLSKDETSMLALWSLRAKNVPYSLDIFADMKLSVCRPHLHLTMLS